MQCDAAFGRAGQSTTVMKDMIRAGHWAKQNKYAAAEILDQQTFHQNLDHTYQGIRDVDLVPNLGKELAQAGYRTEVKFTFATTQ
ncbi:MAG: hypothetical protein ACKO24_11695 [Leptolyngbyaceae cyanobacterium]